MLRAAHQASGSGGTAGGIALGLRLAGHGDVRVHAFGVCDDPDYFYDYIDGLYRDMGATPDVAGALSTPFSASRQAPVYLASASSHFASGSHSCSAQRPTWLWSGRYSCLRVEGHC